MQRKQEFTGMLEVDDGAGDAWNVAQLYNVQPLVYPCVTHVFGWGDESINVDPVANQPRGWPDEHTLSPEAKKHYEIDSDRTGVTYLTPSDIEQLDPNIVDPNECRMLSDLIKMGEWYGEDSVRMIAWVCDSIEPAKSQIQHRARATDVLIPAGD